MAGNTLPPWFISAVKEKQMTVLPKWFMSIVGPASKEEVEEVDQSAALLENKAEGGFVEQLQAQIRKSEAPRFGYDSWFGRGTNRGPAAPPKPPTQMTVDEVLEWQNTNNPPGPGTAAIGAYQIVDQPNARTLSGLKRDLKLKGDELFTAELQDRMARHLLERRGLNDFLNGRVDHQTFANNVAKEWASLPVLKPTNRGRRQVEVGQSYYHGDGINKSFFQKNPDKLKEYEELFTLAINDAQGEN